MNLLHNHFKMTNLIKFPKNTIITVLNNYWIYASSFVSVKSKDFSQQHRHRHIMFTQWYAQQWGVSGSLEIDRKIRFVAISQECCIPAKNYKTVLLAAFNDVQPLEIGHKIKLWAIIEECRVLARWYYNRKLLTGSLTFLLTFSWTKPFLRYIKKQLVPIKFLLVSVLVSLLLWAVTGRKWTTDPKCKQAGSQWDVVWAIANKINTSMSNS